ncbi:beta-lactamase/transpeptidase-like protein, partial [Fusarium tricinctum]
VTAMAPCPLFGPDLPIPTALNRDVSIRSAMSEILQLLNPDVAGGTQSIHMDFQNTSFSIDVYSTVEQKPLINHHHAAPSMEWHERGTHTVNDTTIYRIGSISKLLTAYLYLIEVGDTSFSEPITQYVPELAALPAKKQGSAIQEVDWDVITIGALASHMAGIPRDPPRPATKDLELAQLGFPPVNPTHLTYCGEGGLYPCNRSAFFDSIRPSHPVEVPFSTPIYSNVGYQILGYALENITGSTYSSILSHQLILPLRLNSTTYARPDNAGSSIIPNDSGTVWYDVNTGDAGPAAGVYSSIADLRRIGRSILTYELLSPAQTRRWMKPVTFTADPHVAVGAPWEIAKAPSTSGRASWMYTKGGQIGSYNSLVALLPDWGVGITVLAAGSNSAGVTGVLPGLIASKLVPALEEAAKTQANLTYGGHYGSRESNMTIAVDSNLPGLGVTSWFHNGHDMFDSIRSMITGPGTSNGPGHVSMRLYRTGLETYSCRREKKESWRAVYEVLDPASPPASRCVSWFSVDSVTYGGESIDKFVFDLVENGVAQGLTVSAFDSRL